MMAITDATMLISHGTCFARTASCCMFHGWADPEGQAEPTLNYYLRLIEDNVRGAMSTEGAGEGPIVHVFPEWAIVATAPDATRLTRSKRLSRRWRKAWHRITSSPTTA